MVFKIYNLFSIKIYIKLHELVQINDLNRSYYHFEEYFIKLKSYLEKVGFEFQQSKLVKTI
jgi:hypothetical protein